MATKSKAGQSQALKLIKQTLQSFANLFSYESLLVIAGLDIGSGVAFDWWPIMAGVYGIITAAVIFWLELAINQRPKTLRDGKKKSLFQIFLAAGLAGFLVANPGMFAGLLLAASGIITKLAKIKV